MKRLIFCDIIMVTVLDPVREKIHECGDWGRGGREEGWSLICDFCSFWLNLV